MKTLVVCDSVYGNTAQIARAIVDAMSASADVQLLRVGDVDSTTLAGIDFLIVGSPTHGGRATPAMQEFLRQLPVNALQKVGVTAFDTRFSVEGQHWALRILMNILGFAAGRIAKALTRKGGKLVAPAQGFIVEGKEGPLKAGELERAADWARTIQTAGQPMQYAVG